MIEIPEGTYNEHLPNKAATVYYFYRCRRDKISTPATAGDVLRHFRRNRSVPHLCPACHNPMKLGRVEVADLEKES